MQDNILILETAKIILSRNDTSKMSELEIYDKLKEISDNIRSKLNEKFRKLSANDIDMILKD